MVRRTPVTDEQTPKEKVTSDDMGPGSNAAGYLLSFVERIERLSEEIGALSDDRTEVFGEAKSVGFDTRIIRQVVQRRKMARNDLLEEDRLRDLYEDVLRAAEKAQVAQSVDDGE